MIKSRSDRWRLVITKFFVYFVGQIRKNDNYSEKSRKKDMPVVIEMFHDLADFLNSKNRTKLTVEDLYRDGGFDDGCPRFFSLLAEDSESKNADGTPEAVGHSMCSYMYSWDGKTLFMNDFFLKESHRSKGIGKIMFNAVLKHAKEARCNRVEFHVFDWNPAKQFYQKMGAINVSELNGYQYYRVYKDVIDSIDNK